METRLDIWLVDQMGVKSRSKAQELIKGGFVLVNGKVTIKSGEKVSEKDVITLADNDVLKYVSRGGLKLEKAIMEFGLDFKDKTVLDIGSSTGGFTDCALKAGAKRVIAVDVGTDVMDHVLRMDSRVELYENTDIREFPKEKYRDIDYAVCDASFISLPVALGNLGDEGQGFTLVALIKPQFECGIKAAKKFKGVINDKKLHYEILERVLGEMYGLGFRLKNITFSPICGGDGNVEYVAEFFREGKRAVNDPTETDRGKKEGEHVAWFGNSGITGGEIGKLIEKAFENLKK